MNILTTANAKTALTIRSISNPEWGCKKFNLNAQPLSDGRYASSFGAGSNQGVLFESEYKFWEVITTKTHV